MAITDKLTDIAIKIRNYTKKEKLMKLDEMPAEIEEVYNVGMSNGYTNGAIDGYERGNSDGFTLGTEHGQMVERNAFWDEYQRSWDNVINATQIFSGAGWTDKIYNPNPEKTDARRI